MAFRAVVLADSVSLEGCRLTTFELTYPRIVHAEMMTHRLFSRNSASTRAIPLSVQLYNLLTNPFIPEKFGVNQPGMQAYRHLEGMKYEEAVKVWLQGRDRAITTVIELILGIEKAEEVLQYDSSREYVSGDVILEHFEELKQLFPKSTDDIDLSETGMLNVHKQLAGRGLESYMWHTIVLTATEFDNFFALRDHPDAQGEIATIARLMKKAYVESTPKQLQPRQWHLPYVTEGEFDNIEDAIKSSVARAAATSYNRQHVHNPERERGRYNDLLSGGHMSPFEHQATPFTRDEWRLRRTLQNVAGGFVTHDNLNVSAGHLQEVARLLEFSGNLRGWTPHRKQIANEYNFGELPSA